jgi:Pyruvate/2-oxoacid:ferredoxin oxidoreductase delta subunit
MFPCQTSVSIKKIIIFFFSGTGNAKRIALWLCAEARENGIECHINNIAHYTPRQPNILEKDALVMFISPIHGFNYPKITLDFIRHFPAGENRVLLMNTRAGMKIGNWITPGLTGIAFLLSSFWLRQKGYRIIGQIPYDMPSNWLSLHPALNDHTVAYIHEAMQAKVKKHFGMLPEGKNLFLSRREMVQDILIAPISLLYYFIGRFIIAKTFYADQHCDNCGICIKECPVDAIQQIDNRPFWTIHCESCMRCMNFCPKKAIQTSHGLLAITIILYSILISLVYNYGFPDIAIHPIFRFVISNLIFFLVLLLLYRVQHLALKSRLLAGIIARTSLTWYKFWGRYKSIADKVWKKV